MTDDSAAAALPEEPEGAVVAVFEGRADLARRFTVHLATSAVERGLIGPREVPRLWERHVLNCACLSELLPEDSTVVDVGSGAGLPGLAVAIRRPDVCMTLVEPLQRRVAWLQEVVTDLALDNVTVVRARAEEVRGTITADVATARAVAALPVLAGWCLPLVREGGSLLAVKGRTAAEELTAAEADLRSLGAVDWEIVRCGEGVLAEPTTVVAVRAGRAPTGAERARAGRSRRARGAGRNGERGHASRRSGRRRDVD